MSALTCKMRSNLQNGNVIHHTPGMIADRFASCIRTETFTSIYTVEGDIARGKFGVVRKVRHKCTDQIYAAKFIRKRRRGQDARADILHEIAVHEIAKDHSRLITLHEVYENNHEMVLVLEYAAGGELFNQCVYEDTFKERDVIRLMRQILESLAFLHDRNIVHLDIKPQNILLTNPLPHGDIKLCDFGLARLVDSSTDFREIVGTPDYIAPEILSYEPISTQTDMWSIGVLTYVMLTGCSPFVGATNQETFLNISQVNLDFPDELFEHVSPQAKDFICQLLQSDPSDRATARDCLRHPWLWHDNHNHQETILLITSPRCLRRPHPICNDETMEDDVSQPKRAKVDDEFVY